MKEIGQREQDHSSGQIRHLVDSRTAVRAFQNTQHIDRRRFRDDPDEFMTSEIAYDS